MGEVPIQVVEDATKLTYGFGCIAIGKRKVQGNESEIEITNLELTVAGGHNARVSSVIILPAESLRSVVSKRKESLRNAEFLCQKPLSIESVVPVNADSQADGPPGSIVRRNSADSLLERLCIETFERLQHSQCRTLIVLTAQDARHDRDQNSASWAKRIRRGRESQIKFERRLEVRFLKSRNCPKRKLFALIGASYTMDRPRFHEILSPAQRTDSH